MYKKSGKQTKHKYDFFRLTIDSVIWQWYSVTLPLCIRIISLQQRNQFGITRSIFAIVNTVYTLHDNQIDFCSLSCEPQVCSERLNKTMILHNSIDLFWFMANQRWRNRFLKILKCRELTTFIQMERKGRVGFSKD